VSALRRASLVLVLAARVAMAAPASERVVLADDDPELQRALTTALLPWKLEIVVVPAEHRQDDETARFIVWREGGELVVFDRQSNATERREAPAGALDPVSAAAAALSVKTLMRLPPLVDEHPPTTPTDDSGFEVRVQAGFDTRIAHGSSDTNVGARFVGAAMVRPWSIAIRFGVAADIGTGFDLDRAGFKGTWTDWEILGLASWTYTTGPWEIEPYAGGGVARSSFAGIEMTVARDETATLGIVRGGAWVRRRFSVLTLGAGVAVDGTLGTPTYTRMGGNNQTLFDVPSIAASFGIVAAADFGR
jgi:hypothetical protein